jgi:hypothetical protein
MRFFRNILVVLAFCMVNLAFAQGGEPEQKTIDNTNALWLGYYTKFRIGAKSFYYGEYHVRRRDFAAIMSKLYLRFGYTHLFTKKFEVTAGIATPFSWSKNQGNPDYDDVVPEFRFWEQMLFVDKLYHAKIYHQIRVEQRWKRDYKKGSEYELSHRFRYRLTTYIPLNSHKLIPGTWFLSAYDEIFIQAGPPITYNHFEDNRLFVGIGYILDNNVQMQMGYMWSFKHNASPYDYINTHIVRLSVYHNMDFYKSRAN